MAVALNLSRLNPRHSLRVRFALIVVSTNGLLERQSVSALPWFQQAQTLQKPYVGNIHELPLLSNLLQSSGTAPNRFLDIARAIRTGHAGKHDQPYDRQQYGPDHPHFRHHLSG